MAGSEEIEDDQISASITGSKRRKLSEVVKASKSKDDMTHKINYFKTLPSQVRSSVKDIEAPVKVLLEEHYTAGEITSTINRGRMSVLKLNFKKSEPE